MSAIRDERPLFGADVEIGLAGWPLALWDALPVGTTMVQLQNTPSDGPNPYFVMFQAAQESRVEVSGMSTPVEFNADHHCPTGPTGPNMREMLACKVCGNWPDELGMITHGRGCYTQDVNGGGVSFVDMDGAQA